MLTLVEVLNEKGWETVISWGDESVTEKAMKKFGIDIEGVKYLKRPWSEGILRRFETFARLRDYDLVFWLSDGSVPFLFGKKNIVHMQVPFHGVHGRSLLNLVKKKFISDFVVNSDFTKRIVDREYGINSKVVYPPVDVEEIEPKEKERAILYVGRFSNLMQRKGHEVAVEAFKLLCNSGENNYELWLAGGTEVGAGELLKELKQESRGYPIRFYEDASYKQLKLLYGKAMFFWSASGFGVDEGREPEKCEHFGISLVEAMAGGCVPLVVKKGGFREIIDDGVNGFFWEDIEELVKKTKKLINSTKKIDKLSSKAVERAEDFSKKRFVREFMEVIGNNGNSIVNQ